MTVQADARGKVYRRITDGVEDFITVKEALEVVNDAMMSGRSKVLSMSSSQGHHSISYRHGPNVFLFEVDAARMPAETSEDYWSTASHRMLLHKFTEPTKDGRARCNKSFRPWQYGDGYSFRTRAECETSEYRHLYTFCPRCEEK